MQQEIPEEILARIMSRVNAIFVRRRKRRAFTPWINAYGFTYEIAVGFLATTNLHSAGYVGPHAIAHATDRELLKVPTLGWKKLASLRAVCPYVPWSEEVERAYRRGVADGKAEKG